MFEVGSTVAGKYRVERELGRGGMGQVVAATHVHLGTQVALKFLNEAMMSEETIVQRFMREARASAQLRSEHICRVLDFGTEGLVPYIVMELLEGTDLAKLVRHAPLDVRTASEYVIQACLGLAEAHAAGVVHRDLKPSNLFLTRRPDGTALVKVFDFGVAKAAQHVEVDLTQTASVIGSPGYMSPEQVRSSKNVDQRSDIWALGVILFKLVTSRMPFKAESITDLAVAIAMDPTPHVPNVPPQFEQIIMRCLEKDPARRFQDVMQLVSVLSPFAGSTHDTVPFEMPPAAYPQPGIADQPTTLRGASGVIHGGPSLARPPAHQSNLVRLRPWIIGAALSIAVGVGVGLTATKGSSAPQPAARVMPVDTAPPSPPAVIVTTPPPVVVAAPPPVPPAAVKVDAKVKHHAPVPAAKPDDPSQAAGPGPSQAAGPGPAATRPKDIGASRI